MKPAVPSRRSSEINIGGGQTGGLGNADWCCSGCKGAFGAPDVRPLTERVGGYADRYVIGAVRYGAAFFYNIGRRAWRLPDQNGYTVERSEEHTSELQSLMRISYAVFCLKKKNKNINKDKIIYN